MPKRLFLWSFARWDGSGAIMVRSRRPKFKRSPHRRKPRSRFADWWVIWRMPILLLIVMAVWWFGFRPEPAEQDWVSIDARFSLCGESTGDRTPGCVVDGDTVIIGYGESRRRIRLTGFDTPELDGACAAETDAAQQAKLYLHAWLNDAPFEWSGGTSPPRDQYGRELREVRRTTNGEAQEYLAETMIEAGLAADNSWGAWPTEWCP